jgi:hypothetical protein
MRICEMKNLSTNFIRKVISVMRKDLDDNHSIEQYAIENDITDTDYNKIYNSRAYHSWFNEEFTGRIYNVFSDIEYLIHNNQLTIYREITAPPDWKPDPNRHIGIYWSWDSHAAEAHWGNYSGNDIEWLITATVETKYINWLNTLAKNACYDYEQEREIELKHNSPIHILSINPRK